MIIKTIQNIQMTSILYRQIASILTNRGAISLCQRLSWMEMPEVIEFIRLVIVAKFGDHRCIFVEFSILQPRFHAGIHTSQLQNSR